MPIFDCRLVRAGLPLSTFQFLVSSFEFPFSSFRFPVSIAAQRAGVMRVFARDMRETTRRSRHRARSASPGASPAHPAAPFRADDTSPSAIASNSYAIILWIIYQEIKGSMHGDLTKSHLDEALYLAAAGTVGALVPGQRSPDPGTSNFSFYH